jgi:hypothetical protein
MERLRRCSAMLRVSAPAGSTPVCRPRWRRWRPPWRRCAPDAPRRGSARALARACASQGPSAAAGTALSVTVARSPARLSWAPEPSPCLTEASRARTASSYRILGFDCRAWACAARACIWPPLSVQTALLVLRLAQDLQRGARCPPTTAGPPPRSSRRPKPGCVPAGAGLASARVNPHGVPSVSWRGPWLDQQAVSVNAGDVAGQAQLRGHGSNVVRAEL